IVSNARDDLPEPLRPVTTVRVLRGISTSIFLRLCWRAPRTVILVIAIWYEGRLPFRNVDRSTGMSDSRYAQLYSVSYYGASGSSLAAGFNAGRLKEPHRRNPGLRHHIIANSQRVVDCDSENQRHEKRNHNQPLFANWRVRGLRGRVWDPAS